MSDPAAGSGGIETLTRELCEAAWSLFQEIEKAGGVFAALEQNLIQRKVAATRAVREANIAKRKEVLTGASEFPNLHEADVAVLDAKPVVPRGLRRSQIQVRCAAADAAGRTVRSAARQVGRHILKTCRRTAKIFLANLGTPADFTARATFAEKLLRDRRHRGHRYARICRLRRRLPPRSRPSGRGDGVPVLLRQGLCRNTRLPPQRPFRAAGAKHIYLAGRPGEQEAALRAAGVDDFIFAGGDALATLQEAWRRME